MAGVADFVEKAAHPRETGIHSLETMGGLGAAAVTVFRVYECQIEKLN